MKKRNVLVLAFTITTAFSSFAQEKITSPDGKLVVTVSADGGKPSYEVDYNGNKFLNTSPLGLNANIGDYTQAMVLLENASIQPVSDSYSLKAIKQSQVDYKANRGVFTFTCKSSAKSGHDILKT